MPLRRTTRSFSRSLDGVASRAFITRSTCSLWVGLAAHHTEDACRSTERFGLVIDATRFVAVSSVHSSLDNFRDYSCLTAHFRCSLPEAAACFPCECLPLRQHTLAGEQAFDGFARAHHVNCTAVDHDLGRARSRVVLARHGEGVGTG